MAILNVAAPASFRSRRKRARSSRTKSHGLVLLIALSIALPGNSLAAPVRLKELVEIPGVRDNDLIGYGLVIGLSGSGDSEQVLFTQQSIAGMLGRLGVRVDAKQIRSRNVAAVMVTARLPGYARPGVHLDVSVSSLGNARSLSGGVLLATPLAGADGQIYALAQGQVQTGGYEFAAAGSLIRKNLTNSGRVPAGATVEMAVAPEIKANDGKFVLSLKQPDFTNAVRVAAAISKALGEGSAQALDPASIEVKVTAQEPGQLITLIAQLEPLEIDADTRAKVVISERTGTIVAGTNVRLRPASVAHGGLRVYIANRPYVSQPGPFARRGETAVVPNAYIEAEEGSRQAVGLPATATVDDLTKTLNSLGATPRDLVAILQALKAAGSLDAELEVI